ncbi:AraC family transcriptional regulator [Seohaeicola saemankumensis]|nr:AraC family transcriptional regulator [Seohaeicola saemankumensis]
MHDARSPRMTVDRAYVGEMLLGRVNSTGHDIRVSEDHKVSVIMPVRGELLTEMAGREYRAGVGQMLIASRGHRQTRVLRPGNADFLALVLIIDQSRLVREAARVNPVGVPARIEGDFCVMADGQIVPEVRHLFSLSQVLAEDLETCQGDRGMQTTDLGWQSILFDKVLNLLGQLNLVETATILRSDAASRHVRTAVDYMQEHCAEIGATAEVATACGISVRTLENAFRSVRGETPKDYLTRIRLEAAREMLLRGDDVATTAAAAYACGFGHTGRFAALYRDRFDEPPSATLGRRNNVTRISQIG